MAGECPGGSLTAMRRVEKPSVGLPARRAHIKRLKADNVAQIHAALYASQIEEKRVDEIIALCAEAGVSGCIISFVRQRWPVAKVRKALNLMTVQ